MTKGCVVYAYDGAYPYLRIAARAAKLVKQQLDLPVTLITDSEYDNPAFDQVIVKPSLDPEQLREFNGQLRPWHNQNRSTVYHLSPYDQTLLIDADYFMFNNTLGPIFDTNADFACFSSTYELGLTQTLEKRIGTTSIPMQWATVIYFTKSELAESVFDFMSYIKQHYEFYSLLYGFRNHQFRNDYALSIALQTLTGYNTDNYSALPGMLVTATDNIHISAIKNNGVFYSYRTGRGLLGSKSVGNNIHFLNKDQLLVAMDIEEYAKS
jgi:hypothetical protein